MSCRLLPSGPTWQLDHFLFLSNWNTFIFFHLASWYLFPQRHLLCKDSLHYNKAKCKTQDLGGDIPWYQPKPGNKQTESSLALKGLRGLVDGCEAGRELAMCSCSPESQLCPGCIKTNVTCRPREGILPLCSSQVRPHPQCSTQLRGPKEGHQSLEQVQRRAPKLISSRERPCFLWDQAERAEAVETGDVKDPGWPIWSLLVPKGSLEEIWSGTSYKGT